MANPVTQPSERVETHSRKSESRGGFLLVSIFRLLLLGVSGSLAALLGVAIAQFYPDPSQEPPIVEKAVRQAQNWVNQQKQALFPAPQPAVVPSPASPIAPSIRQLPPSSTPLSQAERDKLQAELAQLRAQLRGLGDRAATIETQLGAAAPAPPEKALMVTLPSDTLFDATQASLRPESLPILDSLISDLQRYPGATVRVSAHVDEQGAVEADRSRSFEQAKVVKQYLSSKLDDTYQWVAIGYGHSRPLAANSAQGNPLPGSQGDRQRNRRIEIAIEPQ
ncbi:MAG: OmpA family protein [Leptolyngbyaceae cyanobacterium CSU_1_4]|nr:OmpA family protein [Leptolyngbyaceae cyanobacterium CSU_1_4]